MKFLFSELLIIASLSLASGIRLALWTVDAINVEKLSFFVLPVLSNLPCVLVLSTLLFRHLGAMLPRSTPFSTSALCHTQLLDTV